MDKLAQFLPAVMGLLLKFCDSQTPLLRSISCWCVARFGKWIFDQRNPNREQVIASVLKVLLPRCLDRNKRVQEASISSVLNLCNCGGTQLVPYLNDIVDTCVKAAQLYQLINQRILFDTVCALVWAVGPELGKPEYMTALIGPTFQKFYAVPNEDVLAVPLCEAVACLCEVLGKALADALPNAIMKCVKSINDISNATQIWEQRPEEYEKPPIEIMGSCCDLLAAILNGLREHASAIATQLGMLSVIPLAVRHSSSRAKQSGFWLMACGGMHCPELLLPLLPELIPLCAAGLGPTASITVSINASNAMKAVCERAPPDTLTPFLNPLVPALVAIVQRDVKQWQVRGHGELLRNVCALFNSMRQKSALGQQWAQVSAQLPAPAVAQLQQRYGLQA